MYESTLTSKGQTTLPKELRDELQLKPGDKLRYLVSGDVVQIIKPRPLSEMAGCARAHYKGPPVTLDAMEEAIADHLAEKHGLMHKPAGDAKE